MYEYTCTFKTYKYVFRKGNLRVTCFKRSAHALHMALHHQTIRCNKLKDYSKTSIYNDQS